MKTCSLVRGPSETLAYRDSGLSFPECTRMRLEDREQGLLCFGESVLMNNFFSSGTVNKSKTDPSKIFVEIKS